MAKCEGAGGIDYRGKRRTRLRIGESSGIRAMETSIPGVARSHSHAAKQHLSIGNKRKEDKKDPYTKHTKAAKTRTERAASLSGISFPLHL